MKRLWTAIPPCYSDTQGFQAVVNATGGLGIIDDPSRYKPLRVGGDGGRGGEHRRDGRHDRYHGGAEGGHGRHGGGAGRVICSDIRNDDIIHGTEHKVMEAFRQGQAQCAPDFVLLAYAPSSSMIGSDLEAAAERIGRENDLPAVSVDVHGDKDYLYGVGCTLEAMGRLLLTQRPAQPKTVNLLGCNSVDWTEETVTATEAMLADAGWQVLSRWGMKEETWRLRQAAAAQVNLVVTVAGLRLARYMQAEYGTPYVVGAPFGAAWCDSLCRALNGQEVAPVQENDDAPEALVLGEQLTANAIRLALQARGMQSVRVLSLYEMDRACMAAGDRKLTGEDALAEQLSLPSVRLVIGDPDARALMERTAEWIDLPNPGSQYPICVCERFDMVGAAMDRWLDGALKKGGTV